MSVDIGGMEPFASGLNFEFHFLSFGQSLEAVHRDRREVHEDVFTTFLFNEAIALALETAPNQ